ncbi:hypothetical protein [Mycolicibacterium sediminis]|uniref:hypothetical protein n=1 Tax=Mycolicibacterium sediminis TaxID=1286180 RepID=UPI001FE4A610|nr:hypothetical protein [Mycolicibacterium sediminis]
MATSTAAGRASTAALCALVAALTLAPLATADPEDAPGGPVAVESQTSADADPAAVAACGQFAEVLDATSHYYGDFAEEIESYSNPDYSDPAISSSNQVGRTALRQGASVAMSSANTPGLSPDIAAPMRSWSWGATKLLVKMAVRTSGDAMNTTATEMNTDAGNVQTACAAAGTHA